jgi:hypothetical protein
VAITSETPRFRGFCIKKIFSKPVLSTLPMLRISSTIIVGTSAGTSM